MKQFKEVAIPHALFRLRERDSSKERRQLPELPGKKAPIATKPTGLRKILSKIRRNNSGHSLGPGEEQDNKEERSSKLSLSSGWDGLGSQRGSAAFSPHLRLEDWDTDTVCSWFDSLGLYMYSNEVDIMVIHLVLLLLP